MATAMNMLLFIKTGMGTGCSSEMSPGSKFLISLLVPKEKIEISNFDFVIFSIDEYHISTVNKNAL